MSAPQGSALRSVLTPSSAAAAWDRVRLRDWGCRGPPVAEGLAACSEPRAGQGAVVLLLLPHLCWCTRLACGLGWGRGSSDRGHLPCSLWPRCLLGVLGVPDGQHLPGKVWRDQPPIPETLATGRSQLQGAGPAWLHGELIRPGPVHGAAFLGGAVVLLLQRPGQPAGWARNSRGARELGRGTPRGLGGRWFHGWGPVGAAELPDRTHGPQLATHWHFWARHPQPLGGSAPAPLRQGVPRPLTPEGHSAGTGPL